MGADLSRIGILTRREIEARFPLAYRRGGLRIETSAQLSLDNAAQRTAQTHAARLRTRKTRHIPQVAALLWDYHTGYVETAIGGLSCRIGGSAR